jgi:hypothetical protein
VAVAGAVVGWLDNAVRRTEQRRVEIPDLTHTGALFIPMPLSHNCVFAIQGSDSNR